MKPEELEQIRKRNEERLRFVRQKNSSEDLRLRQMAWEQLGWGMADQAHVDVEALLQEVERLGGMSGAARDHEKRMLWGNHCHQCLRLLTDDPHPHCNNFMAHKECHHPRVLHPISVQTGKEAALCADCGADLGPRPILDFRYEPTSQGGRAVGEPTNKTGKADESRRA